MTPAWYPGRGAGRVQGPRSRGAPVQAHPSGSPGYDVLLGSGDVPQLQPGLTPPGAVGIGNDDDRSSGVADAVLRDRADGLAARRGLGATAHDEHRGMVGTG